jgi:hypothetical protein
MATKDTGTESGTGASTDEYSDRVQKRAEHEALEFSLGGPGHIKVRNCSHADPSDHTYIVAIEDREAVECTCPADEYNPGPCKHRVAVESDDALLSAGSAEPEAIHEARQ